MWNPRTYQDSDFGLAEGESFEPEIAPDEDRVFDIRQPHIMTVLGPIAPEELGICLPHVHLLCAPPNEGEDYQLTDPESAESEIEAFITVNGRSLVECSTSDTGRLAASLVGIAGWVPAHLIAVTGRHNHRFAQHMPNALDVEALTREFTSDIQIGMNDTSARAGLIKVGIGKGQMTDVEAASIDAAGRTHQQTGASITTHTETLSNVPNLLTRLEAAGVAPSRVIIGHVDLEPAALDRLIEVASSGAFIQFDQIGKSEEYPDQVRAGLIKQLCDHGLSSQILLSLDYGRKSLLTAYGGQPGLAFLSEWFMVLLMEAGLDAPTIRHLVIENPARAITIIPPAS